MDRELQPSRLIKQFQPNPFDLIRAAAIPSIAAIYLSGISPLPWRLAFFIVFLSVDTLGRLLNRSQIDAALGKYSNSLRVQSPLHIVYHLFILGFELTGVGFLCRCGAAFVEGSPYNSLHLTSFAWFAGLAALQNVVQIKVCPRVDPRSYLAVVLKGDALELKAIAGLWIDRLREGERGVQTLIFDAVVKLVEPPHERIFAKVRMLAREYRKAVVLRSSAHLLFQMAALHVVIFNAGFAVCIALHVWATNAAGFMHLSTVNAAIALALLLCLTGFAYRATTWRELEREGVLNGLPESEPAERDKLERLYQTLGNALLILALILVLLTFGATALLHAALAVQITIGALMLFSSMLPSGEASTR